MYGFVGKYAARAPSAASPVRIDVVNVVKPPAPSDRRTAMLLRVGPNALEPGPMSTRSSRPSRLKSVTRTPSSRPSCQPGPTAKPAGRLMADGIAYKLGTVAGAFASATWSWLAVNVLLT